MLDKLIVKTMEIQSFAIILTSVTEGNHGESSASDELALSAPDGATLANGSLSLEGKLQKIMRVDDNASCSVHTSQMHTVSIAGLSRVVSVLIGKESVVSVSCKSCINIELLTNDVNK